MKGYIIILIVFLCWQKNPIFAQQKNPKESLTSRLSDVENMMKYHQYAQAYISLNELNDSTPHNIEVLQLLAQVNFYLNRYKESIHICNILIHLKNKTVTTYLLLSQNYIALNQIKQANYTYVKLITLFPKEGIAYFQYGLFLQHQKNILKSIYIFKEGTIKDPTFPDNYFEIALYYAYQSTQPILTIFYAENFINLSEYSIQVSQMKKILYTQYKILLSNNYLPTGKLSTWEESFLSAIHFLPSMQHEFSINDLIIFRSYQTYQYKQISNTKNIPLISYWLFLLHNHLFEAYNQWLFGPVVNILNYQHWVDDHIAETKIFKQNQPSFNHYFLE